ncbi:MAG: hypothetical protein JWP89_6101 [Schlesneria sp.]|nr:hypothetical protein [Schlesneria sp.]
MVSDSQVDRSAPATYLADQFSDTIDAVYQHALHENPSFRNQVAYAGYLASHGRILDGLEHFKQIIQNDALAAQPALLHEVGERILRIETRLENDPELWQPIHHS